MTRPAFPGPRITTPTADAAWQDRAACKGSDLPFFTEPAKGHRIPQEIRDLCNACPVNADCLDYALETGSAGIWAGTTERGRRDMRNRR